ncbi:glycosyltransferase family 2 protein [Fodinibius sp. SL11]|uniref:glycosyltransferase family 2 protein n=1 Tax=Fodinibius sp. SL11 TaxID=3425690 RepID=UPI003F880F72
MKFSVIIPTYNDWQRLQQCVMALEGQTLSRDQYEVIVVDNSEHGVIPEEVHLPCRVQLIHEPKPGSYAARNKGAAVATGDIVAFTDSDCIPDKNWLNNAQKYLNEANDLVGGKVEIFQPEGGSKYGYMYERVTAFPQQKNVPLGKGVTANLFVKKDVFEKVGGFNMAIKSGGDWEFTLRCTKAGYQMIYADDVQVKHPARNLQTIFKKHYRLTCGGALKVKREYGYSELRMLGSHIKGGLTGRKKRSTVVLSMKERVIVYSIDLMKFMYRAIIYVGVILRLINPDKVRE